MKLIQLAVYAVIQGAGLLAGWWWRSKKAADEESKKGGPATPAGDKSHVAANSKQEQKWEQDSSAGEGNFRLGGTEADLAGESSEFPRVLWIDDELEDRDGEAGGEGETKHD